MTAFEVQFYLISQNKSFLIVRCFDKLLPFYFDFELRFSFYYKVKLFSLEIIFMLIDYQSTLCNLINFFFATLKNFSYKFKSQTYLFDIIML